MENVKTTVKNGVLTITVDLSKNLGLSQSGKNILVAKGNSAIEQAGVMLNLNVYKRPVAETA